MDTINKKTTKNKAAPKKPPSTLPNGRSSVPKQSEESGFGLNSKRIVNLDYIRKMIPVIRDLMMLNGDVGQAIHNITTLGNTGHKIFFDTGVPEEQVDKMRNHLKEKRTEWASGQAGMDGLVNRMISQLLISGALSNEWVPNANLDGIEGVVFVNPEDIEFEYDARKVGYKMFQINTNLIPKDITNDRVLLNPQTYRYYALNGDGSTPYGFPPYLSVIPKVASQGKMDKNVDYVIDQMGLMGFIECLIQKPDMDDEIENESKYENRLDLLLERAKKRMLAGFKEGVVVGFKDDHEFKFNSASKSYTDAVEIYKNNELMLATSLKQDASLWGRSYATSETQITVVFVKMLSELKNIHNVLKANLEFGYKLELRLAGFEFNQLRVEFNRSTIQDELKSQQAEEIKIRNVKDKYLLGIISQETMADELNYEKSDQPEPRVSPEVLAGSSDKEVGLETDGTKKKAETKKKKSDNATKKRRDGKILPK